MRLWCSIRGMSPWGEDGSEIIEGGGAKGLRVSAEARKPEDSHHSFNADLLCLSEHSFMQFFGDDFLRVLLLRFIFSYVVLKLHRAFKVRAWYLLF
jgi:hypothetical protein